MRQHPRRTVSGRRGRSAGPGRCRPKLGCIRAQGHYEIPRPFAWRQRGHPRELHDFQVVAITSPLSAGGPQPCVEQMLRDIDPGLDRGDEGTTRACGSDSKRRIPCNAMRPASSSGALSRTSRSTPAGNSISNAGGNSSMASAVRTSVICEISSPLPGLGVQNARNHRRVMTEPAMSSRSSRWASRRICTTRGR